MEDEKTILKVVRAWQEMNDQQREDYLISALTKSLINEAYELDPEANNEYYF